MPSERALLLANIIDAAMTEAGYDLVQVGTAPAPTPAAPVTPGSAPAPAQPTPAPAAAPTVSTVWQWDGSLGVAGNRNTMFPSGDQLPTAVASGSGTVLVAGLNAGQQRSMAEVPFYIGEGDDLWTVFQLAISPGYPVELDTWQTFLEFKHDYIGSAPIEFGVRNGHFEVTGGMSHPSGNKSDRLVFGNARADGRWREFQIHTVFSTDPAKGQIDAWLDREAVVQGFRPKGGTLYPRIRSFPRFGQMTGLRAAGGQVAIQGMKIGRTVK